MYYVYIFMYSTKNKFIYFFSEKILSLSLSFENITVIYDT